MTELLIKDGQIIDGTGAPARPGDVRIRDGRIVEVGSSLAPGNAQVVEAKGAIVAPGFIDNHTHYDASLFWDPRCDPMPEHGVTTVLIGNCSLGLAPAKPAGRNELSDVFSFIEDIPRDLFSSLVPWEWEKYDEYARAMATRRLGVNVIGLVPHSWLRTYIMGEDAWKRAATADEVAAMARELEKALRAGARGLSSSLFDKDSKGRPVPSCYADDAELEALYRALHTTGGIGQLIPRHPNYEDIAVDLKRFGVFAKRYSVPVLINAMTDPIFDSTHAQRLLDLVTALQADGAPIYPMMAPSALDLLINFHHSMTFMNVPAWNDIILAAPDEKRRLLNDPEWRARARNDWDTKESMLFPTKNIAALRIVSVGEVPALADWVSRGFGDLAKERGGHPSDVLADWALQTNLEGKLVYPVTNQRPDVVGKLLRDRACVIGGSDAGAHFQAFCGAGDTTLLLTRHVRERGDLTIEEAIHGLTGRQAEVMGLKDRGVIRPGAIADIVIFKLEELRWLPAKIVKDVPGGYPRLRRPPGGYRFTIVGGEMVQCHGHATDLLPGRFLGTDDHQQARLAAE